MRAMILISHGSRAKDTETEVADLLERLKKRSHFPIACYAFLDVIPPDIPTAIQSCAREGATEVILLLNFLNAGNHVLKDIPAILEKEKLKYPKIRFKISPHLAKHPKMEEIFLDFLN